MGGNESAVPSQLGHDIDMHIPAISARLHSEEGRTFNTKSAVKPRATWAHIIKTAFTGVWSILQPGGESPRSRSGQMTVSSPDGNYAYIGCGVTEDKIYLNDFWVLDLTTLSWSNLQLTGDSISPRVGCRGIFIQGNIILFGGYDGNNYLNDTYVIDLNEKTVFAMTTTGSLPSPRAGSVIGQNGANMYVWGGFDGGTPGDLFILDLESAIWRSVSQDVTGRASPAFAQKGPLIYVTGSSKVGGITLIDTDKETVQWIQTTGAEPLPSITDAAMEVVDEFVLLFGGRAQSPWSLVYALDVRRKWWFVVHVLPDNCSVSELDGHITDLGLFMLPRTHGMGMMYCPARRSLFACLGSPYSDPPPHVVLSLEEALGVLHLRDDMIEALHTGISMP